MSENDNKNRELLAGLKTAYVDGTAASQIALRPGFVSNNYKEGRKVLSTIEEELLRCDRFQISVAFITLGGITPLLQTLRELEKRQIPGEILTTDYLNFSEPKALEKLNSLSNITLKMYDTREAEEGFHTKGYIFKKEELYRIIIGSSNMTQAALTSNREWNTKMISTESGEIARQIVKEFSDLWNSPCSLEFNEFYDAYKTRYELIKEQRRIAAEQPVVSLESYRLQPNSMQVAFINNLESILESGEDRALLISSTGTGKTLASAFVMRKLKFRKVLFVVHRGQLARQTKKAYAKVFGESVTMGLLGSGYLEYDKDYIFSTVQTLSREEHLRQYAPDHFDCIILDEAHHTSAATYQRLMDYFRPKLWLGMTATPDKRDDQLEGKNIYEIFHHCIAYEIRLQQAMEEKMLCPFHYFGISDLAMIDDEHIGMKNLSQEEFRLLTSEERIRHIIDLASYYGYSGSRVKGLIFCSRIKEAEELSRKMNLCINPETGKYYRTLALNGDSDEKERQNAFDRLAMEEPQDGFAISREEEPLDYIFSVELLNEGVDIVEVNQVIMLRPTQSPIVFIQQLGRGLRKAEGKEYVVILDFIGNYRNNFMIPIALSGDRSYNKDSIRRYVVEGGRVIPGASTIHFDEVSRKRIFEAIDSANFSDIKLIRENYANLKNKLGRVPALKEFDEYGEMDVLRIFDNKSLGSYYKFLVKYEKEYTIRLSEEEEKVIEFVSRKLASGKRVHELELLKRLISYRKGVMAAWSRAMQEKYHKSVDQDCRDNVINILTNEFPAGAGKKTYQQCVFLEADGEEYKCSGSFAQMLENPDFYIVFSELIDFGIWRYHRDYEHTYQDTNLVLYQKYTYEDACRLLNWENNEVPLNIGGYKYDRKTKTFPVFINYDKSSDISDTTKYEDHFENESRLIAISKSKRFMDSEDVQNFLHAKERGIDVELFVRKNKDDRISKEFYYLGRMQASGQAREFVMPNTNATAVEIEWILDTPVREDIYSYIVNE